MSDRATAAALAMIVASAWITPFRRQLFIGDETKYAEVVREMRATGAVFLPTLNGAPFTHKPPLHFWIIDLLTYPFGIYSAWPFVIPSLAAFIVLLWLMWRMGGALAAFVCGASLMVWGSAQTARMDVSFTLLITFGAWMLQLYFDREDARALVAAGVALGIATLIKGPMAPVIGIVLYLFETGRRRRGARGVAGAQPARRLRAGHHILLAALVIMAVIPLLWFVPAMLIGGQTYTREVIVKQTVGRAVASWVHSAPPWFYLLHMPGILFPWFFLALAALRGANRFYLSWILAVLVPYSVMSSKLDVYMMAMIPPVALMIGDFVRRLSVAPAPSPAERRESAAEVSGATLMIANVLMLALFASAALFVKHVPAGVRPLLIILAISAVIALMATYRSHVASTLAVGIVPLIPLACGALTMMPRANEIGSTQRLIAAIEKQHVAPESVALYSCPYLWSRDFPRELERVRYVDAENIGAPTLIATSRTHASEIAPALRGYHRVDELQMIGKWFDVYRR